MNEHPYVGPPPGGLDRALREARRRRWRTAGVGSGSAMALALVAAALVAQTGTQSLTQLPDTEIPAVVGIDESHETAPVERPNTVLPAQVTGEGPSPADPGSSASAEPGLGGATAPATTGSTGSGTGPATPDDATSTYRAGPLTSQQGIITVGLCGVDSESSPAQMCPQTTASTDQGVTTLDGQICSTQAETESLHFASHREVDFAISRDGRVVWRWSTWHPDRARPHTQPIQPGTCNSWTFGWTQVDSAGTRVPAGTYVLTTTFFADEVSDRRVKTVEFTL
jgi:hypothetical protein